MKNIITLTLNPSVDKSTTVPHIAPDAKLRCAPPGYEPGGGGINVSRAMKRLGGRSTAVHTAGGAPGDFLSELLDAEGVGHYAVKISGRTRENLTVHEKFSGLQYRFGMPGPEMTEEEAERVLGQLRKNLGGASRLVISGSLPRGAPEDLYARAASLAKKHDVDVVLDSSGPAMQKALDEGVFIAKPNIRELENLSGRKFSNPKDLEDMGRSLIDSGKVEVLVLSMGYQGALLVTEKDALLVPSPTVPVKSQVGAGDSMVAGMLFRLASGVPLQEAVVYGVAAGAAAVMTPGSELCRKEAVDALYETMQKENRACS